MREAPVPKALYGPGTEITIGVDVGTTAVKAVAVDGRGRVRARSRVRHMVHVADPDSFEHDAHVAWYQGPRRAVADLGPIASGAVALGISACVPSLVALGDGLQPLSPGLLYGDWRGRSTVTAWPPVSPLDIREGEAFLHWAARHWPGARAYWPAQALAAVALGGEPVIDSFTAMSFFPVFDGRCWNAAELSRIGITEEQLPIVVTEIGTSAYGIGPRRAGEAADRRVRHQGNGKPARAGGHDAGGTLHDPRGTLHDPGGTLHDPGGTLHDPRGTLHDPRGTLHDPGGRAQCGDGERARTVLAPGGVDVMTEQITAGVSQPGEAHIMCGTTLLTWAVMPDTGDVPGLWRFPHLRPGLCLLGGPSNAGGLFLGWARRLLGGAQPRREETSRGGLHPDRVPLWTPYVRGERIPLHDASLRSSLHGLDLTHDATALRRAAYEAAGFVARRILDMAGCTPARIVATGGGVRDNAWMQALADCIGAPVVRAAVPEGAALGMAWMARMAAGLEPSLDGAARWFRAGRVVRPDERWARACARRYELFLDLATDVRAI